MWENYFSSDAQIYGLAYGESEIEIIRSKNDTAAAKNTRLFFGSQTDNEVLDSMLDEIASSIDIVIDDGSHDPADQMFTFEKIFPHVSAGGLYVIEDVETSYWNAPTSSLYGSAFKQPLGLGKSENVVSKFMRVVNFGKLMNGLFLGRKDRASKEDLVKSKLLPMGADDIASVQFAQNLIIVRKRGDDDLYFDKKNTPYIHRLQTI